MSVHLRGITESGHVPRGVPASRARIAVGFRLWVAWCVFAGLFGVVGSAEAQTSPADETPVVAPPVTIADLQQQILQLRQEVATLRTQQSPPPMGALPALPSGNDLLPEPGMPPNGASNGGPGSSAEDTADPASGLPGGEGPSVPGGGDNFPLRASYRYNAGGGYTSLSSKDGTFTLNVQNLISLDATFYDKSSVNTPEQGFNLPFDRMYFFGNITKDWDYQIAFQEALGTFNVLDMWLNYHHSDEFNIRAGRIVTPFLYEYYTIYPAWSPVITLSPLAQLGGHRHEGVMAWGRLLDKKIQYQQGVWNSAEGTFYNLSRNVDYIGDVDVTPFKGENEFLDSLGGGIGVQTGLRQYSLQVGSTNNFINGGGEPTANNEFFGSSGVPFFVYNTNMAADGLQTRVNPHLYWFGQCSLLAEYVYQQRNLVDTATGIHGLEQINGYYFNLSYFLTGERYRGDGLSSYTAISPNRPFIPSQHIYGSGAWELGLQYSQLQLGQGVVNNGFADPLINATRLNQTMVGVNWWMNKYTKLSFDWVNANTNKAVPIGSNGTPTDHYNIYWARLAMFF